MSLPNLESLIVIVKPNSIYAEEVFTYPENAARCWTQNVLQCWTENWTENVLITHADTEGLITRRSSKAAAATWATSAAHLQLNLTFRPKNLLKGFIFGTDENTCDVLLQRSRATGISGNHFSIQIDWDTGNPILSCLSERGISLKDERTGEYVRTLYRDGGETVLPGATLLVEVIDRFELTISCPDRGRLQPVYDRNLEDYYRNYKDAVPDVSTMLLDRPDMTPFILHRCTGLNGGEYYTTQKMATGDTEYDSKVFLYYAKSKSAAGEIGRIASPEPKPISRTRGKQPEGRLTQPDTTRLQSNVAGFDTVKESFLENAKSQIYVVKHFRDKQGDWDETSWIARRLNLLKHVSSHPR